MCVNTYRTLALDVDAVKTHKYTTLNTPNCFFVQGYLRGNIYHLKEPFYLYSRVSLWRWGWIFSKVKQLAPKGIGTQKRLISGFFMSGVES